MQKAEKIYSHDSLRQRALLFFCFPFVLGQREGCLQRIRRASIYIYRQRRQGASRAQGKASVVLKITRCPRNPTGPKVLEDVVSTVPLSEPRLGIGGYFVLQ